MGFSTGCGRRFYELFFLQFEILLGLIPDQTRFLVGRHFIFYIETKHTKIESDKKGFHFFRIKTRATEISTTMTVPHSTRRPSLVVHVSSPTSRKHRELPGRKTRGTKRVRFSTPETNTVEQRNDDGIGCAQVSSATYRLTDEDIRSVWWSTDELDEQSCERRQLVQQFQNERPEYSQQYCTLYNNCARLSISQIARMKSVRLLIFGKHQQQKQATVNDGIDRASAVSCNDEDDIRGLESRLTRAVAHYRKNHVQQIVRMQNEMSSDEKLSAQSLQSSRSASIIARLWAQADAMQARGG